LFDFGGHRSTENLADQRLQGFFMLVLPKSDYANPARKSAVLRDLHKKDECHPLRDFAR
jgi:hypothetical protein